MAQELFSDQFPMFNPDQTPNMILLRKKKDYEELFSKNGLIRMKMVSYVASPSQILAYLKSDEQLNLEIVLGDGLTGKEYKSDLRKTETSITEKLVRYIQEGRLRILVPRKTNHSKFYLLYKPLHVRVIQTSANLTYTASQPSKQNNNAFYWDLPYNEELLKEFENHYEQHTKDCDLFMGDLIDLFKKHPEDPSDQLIQTWLTNDDITDEADSVSKLLAQIASEVPNAIQQHGNESIITLTIPEGMSKTKGSIRKLAGLEHRIHDRNLSTRPVDYLNFVQKTCGIPFLSFDAKSSEMTLGFNGNLRQISHLPTSPEEVNEGLQQIEDYLDTVNNGETSNELHVQRSMFEALLYIFSSPFSTEFIRDKDNRYGSLDTRGPRFLYIYGPSSNGKTTFLKFALKMMTGVTNIRPLGRGDFSKTKIRNQSAVGTCFPLLFDDVKLQGKPLEDVIKSYWETHWNRDIECYPQIVMTSNESRLPDWARSRMKRVDFDIHFVQNPKHMQALNELFQRENDLYGWFAFLYMEKLQNGVNYQGDELYAGREVFRELYTIASRSIPESFPQKKLEEMYDPGLNSWLRMLRQLKKVKIDEQKGLTLAEFSSDMKFYEVNDYASDLPSIIKHHRKGNTLVIENPAEFKKWLGGKKRSGGLRHWLDRLSG